MLGKTLAVAINDGERKQGDGNMSIMCLVYLGIYLVVLGLCLTLLAFMVRGRVVDQHETSIGMGLVLAWPLVAVVIVFVITFDTLGKLMDWIGGKLYHLIRGD